VHTCSAHDLFMHARKQATHMIHTPYTRRPPAAVRRPRARASRLSRSAQASSLHVVLAHMLRRVWRCGAVRSADSVCGAKHKTAVPCERHCAAAAARATGQGCRAARCPRRRLHHAKQAWRLPSTRGRRRDDVSATQAQGVCNAADRACSGVHPCLATRVMPRATHPSHLVAAAAAAAEHAAWDCSSQRLRTASHACVAQVLVSAGAGERGDKGWNMPHSRGSLGPPRAHLAG
jgi:hypothetical protein